MKLKIYSLVVLLIMLLSANSANAQWTRNAPASQTYTTFPGDSVGIGTSNPKFKLDVQGTGVTTMSFKSTTDNASILLDRGASTKTSSLTYRTAGVNNWQTGCVSNNNYTIRNNGLGQLTMYFDYLTNNIGIGTNVPANKLSVVGNVDINGNVGIGNAAPAFKLDVSGTGNFTGALKVGAYTLPIVDGASGQVLKTNGTGTLTWSNDNSSGGGGGTVTSITAGTGLNGGTITTSGTISAQNTTALWNANQMQGKNVVATVPTTGQVLKYDGTNWKPDVDNNTTYGAGTGISFSGNTINSVWTANGNNVSNNNSANVGIGTSTPTGRLVVANYDGVLYNPAIKVWGNDTTQGIGISLGAIFSIGSGSGVGYGSISISSRGVGSLNFYTNSLLRLLIDGSGNIGVGKIPTTKLDVGGDIRINGSKIYLRDLGNMDNSIGYDATVDGPLVQGFNGGALGTSGLPNSFKWDYIGNCTVRSSLRVDDANLNDGGFDNALSFGNINTGEFILSKRTSGGNQNGLDFYTDNTNRMAIINSGNVGIGTTAPSSKLEIKSNSTGTSPQLLLNEDDADYARLNFMNNTPNAYWSIGALNNATQASERFSIYNSQAGADLVTISGNGNVGIGQSSPNAKLEIKDGNLRLFNSANNKNYEMGYDAANAYFYMDEFGSGRRMVIKDGGAIGMNTTTPSGGYILTVAGSALASGGTWTNSDARYKTNIKQVEHALESVLKLNGVTYNYKTEEFPQWKFDDSKQIGVIAQEVEKIFPELVKTDADGYKAVSYEKFTPVLIEAIKEQQKQIEEKDAGNDQLKKDVEILKIENADMKVRLKQFENALIQCCSCSKSAIGNEQLATDMPSLQQNAPNPFSVSTVIKYYLPQSVKSAVIKITSINGDATKSFAIANRGVNQLIISGNSLSAGTYTYTLIADDKTVDSKLMTLTK